jgi:hypothetical protein
MCVCGNLIADKEAPNPNAFRLYSDAEVDDRLGRVEDVIRGDAPAPDDRFWVRDLFAPTLGAGLMGLRCDNCYRLLLTMKDQVIGIFRPELGPLLHNTVFEHPKDVIADGRWSAR